MRMRRKKHGDERREALSHLLIDAAALTPGQARGFFTDPAKPLMLEIGCGKGDFVIGMAKKHPEWNFLAMERVPDVILCAMEKCSAENPSAAGEASLPPDNIRFCIANANALTEYFAPGEIDGIYLNFSDPWPKSGHEKRRLTYGSFLAQYRTVMDAGRTVTFKTDNRGLFDYSLLSFEANGWTCEDVTYDLHNSIWNADNVVTEYERNFSEKGFSINRVVAYAPKTNPDVLPVIPKPDRTDADSVQTDTDCVTVEKTNKM
ncbi:MAG: tRNA (guanosine(46)-N7)-methyltransferase TrmB [Clostridia bacterium]|nr:tRNA (guanosine(46)-N7)-methyltransferase TrmB [Clostridia bacterium]